jgi:uncharacterized protein involved in response to NO
MSLLTINDADESGKKSSLLAEHPVLRPGFRTFYLLGAAFAALGIPAWLLHYYGLARSYPHIDLDWHAHEKEG